jgi:hypothetical protein
VVPSYPIEWFDLIVRVFGIIHEKFLRDFVEGVAFRLDGRSLFIVLCGAVAMIEFPGIFFSAHVIADVFHIPAAFEHQGLQSFFTEFFGGPASGDAGADHNGVESVYGHVGNFFKYMRFGSNPGGSIFCDMIMFQRIIAGWFLANVL